MTQFPGLTTADRATRRHAIRVEKRERANGKWGIFERFSLPAGAIASAGIGGWTQDIHTVYKNDWLIAMIRTCRTRVGFVEHAAIRTASETELTWAEKQRLKDALFGPITCAVEVFPARDRLIDQANMYHLWIYPMDFDLPFGIGRQDECSSQHFRPEHLL